MAADKHIGHHRVFDRAVLSDQECCASNTDTKRSVDVIHFDSDFLGIAKQDGDLQADRLDIVMDITDVAGFFRTTGCEVGRVEIQNKWTVLQQSVSLSYRSVVRDAIIYIDPDNPMNLQNQIRQKLVDGIINGAFPPGMKLPSSRKLSQQLDVARNTVVAAYQLLVADGYLVSKHRSGIFVNEKMLEARVGAGGKDSVVGHATAAPWLRQESPQQARGEDVHHLPNWSRYPYPFIDGKFDSTLFPLTEWREANRLSLSVADTIDWSTGSGDADDPMLLEEIRTKILTRRGIQARPDQILITMGTQNSLYLISQILADKRTTAAIEEPGNYTMRELLQRRGATVWPQTVDKDGLVVSDSLSGVDVVYVTPSHQI